jgi:hypothetical protein
MLNAEPAGGTAQLAWSRSSSRHRFAGDYTRVPTDRPFFWSGGRLGYGHVAVSIGGGWCYGVDLVRPGRIDLHQLADVARRWELHPLGWCDDINGKQL